MTNKLTINLMKLSIVVVAAMTLSLMAAFSFTTFVAPNRVGATVSNVPDYCDPSQKPGGQSIGQWVPKDIHCVEPSVNVVCGAVEGAVNNLTPLSYGISWSEGSPDYNFDTSLPASFPEDYNGGSVEVFYWVVGAEADYVTGRNIPNFWEQNAASVTVNTDCEEESAAIVSVSDEKAEPQVATKPVGGVNAGSGNTAATVTIAALLIGSLASLAYGVVRFSKFNS